MCVCVCRICLDSGCTQNGTTSQCSIALAPQHAYVYIWRSFCNMSQHNLCLLAQVRHCKQRASRCLCGTSHMLICITPSWHGSPETATVTHTHTSSSHGVLLLGVSVVCIARRVFIGYVYVGWPCLVYGHLCFSLPSLQPGSVPQHSPSTT